jgi:hypothetical protein
VAGGRRRLWGGRARLPRDGAQNGGRGKPLRRRRSIVKWQDAVKFRRRAGEERRIIANPLCFVYSFAATRATNYGRFLGFANDKLNRHKWQLM